MKIVLATPIYPPEIGGPATYTVELANKLKDKHELTIITYTNTHKPVPGTRLVSINKNLSLPARLTRYFLELWKLAPSNDLIYVQNAMASGFPVALVSMLRNIPYALKFVGDEAWERATQERLTEKSWREFLDNPESGLKIKFMKMLQGFVLRHARIVTTPSAHLAEDLIRFYGVKREQAVVNYNAAEKTETLPFEAKPVPYQIVTTARLIALKQIDGIIKALPHVKKKFPKARLVIGGNGPEMENLKKLSNKLGLTDDVIFLGKISRAETWQLRKNSSVYVLNSTHEGLPITVLTSFAAGIPTVATNAPGTNEVISHEKTGLLVEPGNTEDLASAIERLFEDENLRQRIIDNGHKIITEKFSWETHLMMLEKIFQSVAFKPGNIS